MSPCAPIIDQSREASKCHHLTCITRYGPATTFRVQTQVPVRITHSYRFTAAPGPHICRALCRCAVAKPAPLSSPRTRSRQASVLGRWIDPLSFPVLSTMPIGFSRCPIVVTHRLGPLRALGSSNANSDTFMSCIWPWPPGRPMMTICMRLCSNSRLARLSV
ncbi:hypothetical protein BC628DRAFT_86889 [Trametes gibbosa]|nr:hypothetical protein BC628DRAFT_86889 [Trametes gibbosa]